MSHFNGLINPEHTLEYHKAYIEMLKQSQDMVSFHKKMRIIREYILKGEDYKNICFDTHERQRLEEIERIKQETSTHFKNKNK